MVNDRDRAVKPPPGANDDVSEPFPVYDDGDDERLAEYSTGLVSLGFITAALRRGVAVWGTAAVIGFLIGLGIYVASPPSYQASTTVVLVPNPDESPADGILTDIALAQSRTVASRVIRQLGLHESVPKFLSSYTVLNITDRVLLITVGAPTSSEAVAQAKAVATEFLRFRAQQAQAQEQLLLPALQNQIAQAQQHLKSLGKQISQVSAQPVTPAQQNKLTSLRAQRSLLQSQLPSLEAAVSSNQASMRLSTTQMEKGSEVLDPAAPLPHSHYKRAVLYAAAGLIAGLALGMGFVIVRALVSNRLRRRDDVAYALGAPVRLSVGRVQPRRGRPGRRGLAAARGRDMQHIAGYLRTAIPRRSRRAALAVVALDDERAAALAVISLALSCAKEGKQVVVADLSSGAQAAGLLGVKKPGIRTANVDGLLVVVALPDSDNVMPAGPLRRTSREDQSAPPGKLVAACESADLLLTLVALDPAVGGEHLATWATDAVVMVTAGRSTWTRIHAVGEMIRLAGTRLVSAVLIGADKTDESLGRRYTPEDGRDSGVAEEGPTAAPAKLAGHEISASS